MNGSGGQLASPSQFDPQTNWPTQITDPRGSVTAIQRNSGGLPTSITEGSGGGSARTTAISYNAYGQPVTITNANGHLTTMAYHGDGVSKGYLSQQVAASGELNLTTNFETDARGNVTAIIDSRGQRTTLIYNELDWLVERREPLGRVTRYFYNAAGQLVEEVTPFGDNGAETRSTIYSYGPLGEVTSVSRQVDSSTLVTEIRSYDGNLNLVSTMAPEGETTVVGYNERDLPISALHTGPGVNSAERIEVRPG